MEHVEYIFKMTVYVILDAVLLAMFVRVILSWFPIDPEGRLYSFLCLLTEPFVLPIRLIFDRFGFGEGMMLDIPFFCTYIILSIVSMALGRGL